MSKLQLFDDTEFTTKFSTVQAYPGSTKFFRSAFIMQYKFIYTRYKYKYLDSTDYSDLNFLLLEFSVQIFHDWSLFFPGISYIGAANIF